MLHIFGKTACRFLVCTMTAAVAAFGLAPAIRAQGAEASVALASQTQEPQVTAETAVAMDVDSGQIYYQKNMHQQMYPASITKIMTGLLTVEKGNPSAVVTIQPDIGKSQSKEYTNVALQPGEQLTEDQLLYTMFLASANDSAQALAEQIGGSVPGFVAMMNERVRELGGTETSFSNPNGLPDVNNKTSAHDMALIASQAVKSPVLLQYFGAEHYTLPATNRRAKPEAFTTLVKMLRHDSKYYYPGIIAAKSGWTVMSGYTLVTVARRNDRTVACVVMKSGDGVAVMADSQKLLDYAFSQQRVVPESPAENVPNPDRAVEPAKAVAAVKEAGSSAPDSQTVMEMVLTGVGAAAVLVMLLIVRRRVHTRGI